MQTLPRFGGEYLNEFPFAAQRLHTHSAKVPLLLSASEATFASDQKAAEQVRDLEGRLARELARPKAERDLAAEQTLQVQLAAAREARAASEKAVKDAIVISHGTKLALENVIKLIAGTLSGENAKLSIASVKLPKDADVQYVHEQRDAINGLDDQMNLVKAAPAPRDEVLGRALAELSIAAKRGAVGVSSSGALVLPQAVTDARPIIGTEAVKVPDTFAMLAALFESQIAQQIRDAVEAHYRGIPDDVPLSASAKKVVLDELASHRFEVELAECAAVFKLWFEGHSDIGLRADASPLAILGVSGWTARPRREEPLQWVDVPPINPHPRERRWVGEAEELAKART